MYFKAKYYKTPAAHLQSRFPHALSKQILLFLHQYIVRFKIYLYDQHSSHWPPREIWQTWVNITPPYWIHTTIIQWWWQSISKQITVHPLLLRCQMSNSLPLANLPSRYLLDMHVKFNNIKIFNELPNFVSTTNITSACKCYIMQTINISNLDIIPKGWSLCEEWCLWNIFLN